MFRRVVYLAKFGGYQLSKTLDSDANPLSFLNVVIFNFFSIFLCIFLHFRIFVMSVILSESKSGRKSS